MTNKQALLFAMVKKPKDVALRLAYADLIQEEGNETIADFIRRGPTISRQYTQKRWYWRHRTAGHIYYNSNDWRIGLSPRDKQLILGLLSNRLKGKLWRYDVRDGLVRSVKYADTADYILGGPDLLRNHPIEYVSFFLGRSPCYNVPDNTYWWDESLHGIPNEFAKYLPKRSGYKTMEAAYKALSRAALTWARNKICKEK